MLIISYDTYETCCWFAVSSRVSYVDFQAKLFLSSASCTKLALCVNSPGKFERLYDANYVLDSIPPVEKVCAESSRYQAIVELGKGSSHTDLVACASLGLAVCWWHCGRRPSDSEFA